MSAPEVVTLYVGRCGRVFCDASGDRTHGEVCRCTLRPVKYAVELFEPLRGRLAREPGAELEERHWLRQKLKAAIVHLRDVEDYYRTKGGLWERQNQERADRARGIYEQITEDFLNGRLGEPTMRQRAEVAEEELRTLEGIIAEAQGMLVDGEDRDSVWRVLARAWPRAV